MNRDLKRVVGFILYHKGRVTDKHCDVCVRASEKDTSTTCANCNFILLKPKFEENKTILEDRLPPEVVGLLDKIKVFTADEVVELVHEVIRAILTTPHLRIEDVVDEIFLKKEMILKKSDGEWSEVE